MADVSIPPTDQRTYPMPTARVAARVVLVECPDNPANPNGCLPPRGGFDTRAMDRYKTLKDLDGPFVNGVIAFTWENDPASDAELIVRSAQIVHDELALNDEWDGYSGWYGDHAYIENLAAPGTCAFKPRDVHNQLPFCGEDAFEHEG